MRSSTRGRPSFQPWVVSRGTSTSRSYMTRGASAWKGAVARISWKRVSAPVTQPGTWSTHAPWPRKRRRAPPSQGSKSTSSPAVRRFGCQTVSAIRPSYEQTFAQPTGSVHRVGSRGSVHGDGFEDREPGGPAGGEDRGHHAEQGGEDHDHDHAPDRDRELA